MGKVALRAAGRRALVLGVLALSLCLGRLCAAQAPRSTDGPLAVVTDIEGRVRVLHASRTRELRVLDVLERSDELLLSGAARAEIAFFSDSVRVFQLSGPGRFVLRDDAIASRDGAAGIAVRDLAAQWRTLQLRPGRVARASVALRGASGGGLEVLSPVGAQLDAGALDALRWNPPYGPDAAAWEYAVRLIDPEGSLVLATRTRQTTVALPVQQPWLRERPYLWTVEATADDGRRADVASEFALVDRATEERLLALSRIVEQARAQGTDGRGSAEEVLLAIALDQAGVRSESDRRWRALARQRPAFAAFVAQGP